MSDGTFMQEETDELLAPINKADFEKRKESVLKDIERLVIFDDAVGGLINLYAIESAMNMVKWFKGRGVE